MAMDSTWMARTQGGGDLSSCRRWPLRVARIVTTDAVTGGFRGPDHFSNTSVFSSDTLMKCI
jgi:hypothetical protein